MDSHPSSSPTLLVDADGPVRIVRLNRPEALNATNDELHARLGAVWGELARDEACRAVVFTGEGRAFCAGGDLNVLAKMNDSEEYRRKSLGDGEKIIRAMADFPLPLVTAVNGPAVGLGCSMAGLSDIVIVEESAYFSDPHVSVGLVAGDGGAMTWPLLTSLLKSKEFLFLGDRISAGMAVEMGLANRVVPDGTSVKNALELAHRLARQPAQALRATKHALNMRLQGKIYETFDFAIAAEAISSASPEHREVIDRLSASQKR